MTVKVTLEELMARGFVKAGDGAGSSTTTATASVGFLEDSVRYLDGVGAEATSGTDYRAMLLDVFRHFREKGIEPHPPEYLEGVDVVVEDVDTNLSDEAWATVLGESLEAAEAWVAGSELDEEEGVRPRPNIGLTEMMHVVGFGETYAWRGIDEVSARVAAQRGWFYEMLSDEAKLGVGLIRRFGSGHMGADLDWRSLSWAFNFGGGSPVPIPPPDQLYAGLIAHEYGAFARFTIFAIFCAFKRLCLTPTLFDYGGGSGSAGTPDIVGLAAAEAYKPSFWHQPLYPSDQGWDVYYWDWDDWGALADPNIRLLQQYALFVRGGNDRDPGPPDYWQGCCRRKSEGLLAFSLAVGDFLTLLQETMRSCPWLPVKEATTLIPYLLVDNEMDLFFEMDGEDLVGIPRLNSAAAEMGWFHALLSLPIHVRAGLFRFGMAELASTPDTHATTYARNVRNDWLEWVLMTGLPNALSHPDFQDLVVGAGITWDVWLTDPANLVALIGFHWYHHMDYLDPATVLPRPDLLFEEMRLLEDCEVFRDSVVFSCLLRYPSLTWWISEIGFPAEHPWSGDQISRDDSHPSTYNTSASPGLQAAIVARRLLFMRAIGVPRICWFCFFSEITGYHVDEPRRWRIFNTMGLRSDIVKSRTGGDWWTKTTTGLSEDFLQGQNAVRRPAWYAFRRVAYLLSRSRRVQRLYSNVIDMAVVLRLETRDGGGFFGSGFRYLYVAWMDFSSTRRAFSFNIESATYETDYEIISLVPEIDYGSKARFMDENGYPASDPGDPDAGFVVDWAWTGFDTGGSVIRAGSGDYRVSTIMVYRNDPILGRDVRVPPFCLLSNDRFMGPGPVVGPPDIEMATLPLDRIKVKISL